MHGRDQGGRAPAAGAAEAAERQDGERRRPQAMGVHHLGTTGGRPAQFVAQPEHGDEVTGAGAVTELGRDEHHARKGRESEPLTCG